VSEGLPPPQDTATESDIIQLYRLLLRRDPDDLSSWRDNPPQTLDRLVLETLGSDEFLHANLGPLRTGHVPPTSLDAPPRECLSWASRRLQLGASAKKKLKSAVSYLQVYDILLSQARFKKDQALEGEAGDRSIYDTLAVASRLQALTDIPTSHTLTGWARSTEASDAPIELEVWANGRCLGLMTTGLYRHDAASRLKSKGFEGFQFELPRSLTGRTHIILRDAKSKLILTDVVAELASASPDALGALRREIDGLREAIEGLAKQLPSSLHSATYPIKHYGAYYDAWIRSASFAQDEGSDAPIVVVLDAVGCDQWALEDAVWSLVGQSHKAFSVVVGVLQRDLAFLQDLVARVRWRAALRIDYVIVESGAAWRRSVSIPAEVKIVQLMDATGVAHPDALRCMAAPFAQANPPAAVYCDDDAFAPNDLKDWRDRAHVAPRLKPSLDCDLLLQTPYLGSFMAFDLAHWRASGSADDQMQAGRLEAQRAGLTLALGGHVIAHVPEVLYTHFIPASGMDASTWMQIVADCAGPDVAVEPHQDILGAVVDEACRVRWRAPLDASAMIIVPTRDRVDLLRPCVDSILAALPENVTRTRIHIIDHESVGVETQAYLSAVSAHEFVDVEQYSGPFNWALMNNLAAHNSKEDVLIFLNNDTLVITPDWIDELVSLAMRDDVGVVGCRLVYEDGAVQHSGFLALDERQRFLMHDGLGDQGFSSGYLGRNALVHRTVAVTGACMAVRREVFRRLGGFDAARFQVEANDVDLCFKASDMGLKVLYSPFATLHHLESRTRTLGGEEDVRVAGDAADRIWARWGEKVCPDPWYNPRFDRRAPHFSRLRPR
jgi:hypothetical protein